MLNWFPIADNLKKYLLSFPEFEGHDVHVGDSNAYKIYPVTEIIWIGENPKNSNENKGQTGFHIYQYVKNKDPEEACRLLYEYQMLLSDALQGKRAFEGHGWYNYILETIGTRIIITIDSVVTAGDTQVPVTGSYFMITIDWRAKNEYE